MDDTELTAVPTISSNPLTLQTEPEPLKIDMGKTAVVVVDMQNGYFSQGGYFASYIDPDIVPKAEKIIKPIQRICKWARSNKCKVVYIATSHPADLLAILELVNSDRLGVCLDLGNFYKEQDALAAIAALAPSAVQVHYKARALDPEDDVPAFGYAASLGLLRDLGYDGAFSIEYEGPGPGLEGAVKASGVLRRLWD